MWREKTREIFGRLERCSYLCTAIKEKHIPDDSCPDGGIGRRAGLKHQAESVDALVSNTSGVTSIPVRPRVWVQEKELSICKSNI